MRNLFLYVWKTQRAERKECQKKNEIRKNLLKGVYMYWCMFTHTHIPYIYRYMDFYILYALLTDLQAPHLYACVSVCECVYVYIYIYFWCPNQTKRFHFFLKVKKQKQKTNLKQKKLYTYKNKKKNMRTATFFFSKNRKEMQNSCESKRKTKQIFLLSLHNF